MALLDHNDCILGAFDFTDAASLAVGVVDFRNLSFLEKYYTVRAMQKTNAAFVAFFCCNLWPEGAPVAGFTNTAL